MKTMASIIPFGLTLCSLGAASHQAIAVEQQVKAVAVISGADSKINAPRYELIGTPEDLKRAWTSHLGRVIPDAYAPVFDVDFGSYMIVVVFRGARVNVRGIAVESITEAPDSIRVRFSDVGYQTGNSSNNTPMDQPYAFIVVPISRKRVVVEENVQQYKNEPPKWKVCVNLGPLNATGAQRDDP